MNSDKPFPALEKGGELEESLSLSPRFDQNGLISAIVIDAESREVLMLAHMNAQALDKTLATGQSHFWSRSRGELWHKGATSGDYQNVRKVRIDCDQDAVILEVDLVGPAVCHTGRKSCFYREVRGEAAASSSLAHISIGI